MLIASALRIAKRLQRRLAYARIASSVAAGRRHGCLYAIDSDNFSSIRPSIGICYETSAHWIVAHVIPFLGVALVTAQHVIEESTLPDRPSDLTANDLFLQALLQHAEPSSKREVVGSADEQMEVIGHDDVAADGNVMVGIRSFRELNECMCDRICRQHWPPPICASRHEKDWIARKDARESWRDAGVRTHPVAAALWAAWDKVEPDSKRRQSRASHSEAATGEAVTPTFQSALGLRSWRDG